MGLLKEALSQERKHAREAIKFRKDFEKRQSSLDGAISHVRQLVDTYGHVPYGTPPEDRRYMYLDSLVLDRDISIFMELGYSPQKINQANLHFQLIDRNARLGSKPLYIVWYELHNNKVAVTHDKNEQGMPSYSLSEPGIVAELRSINQALSIAHRELRRQTRKK